MAFLQTYKFGRLTSSALKAIGIYFLILSLLILAALVHGIAIALLETILEGISGLAGLDNDFEFIGFSDLMYNANKLFLLFIFLPLGILIIGIMIVNLYLPFLAGFFVEALNGISETIGLEFSFTPLIREVTTSKTTSGTFGGSSTTTSTSLEFVSFDTDAITAFYFEFVNAMADLLLKISVFDMSAIPA